MDDTLPDDAWKDSFDKILDQRPQLRELNIIKKNVRASFNIDSSVENSNQNSLNVSESSLQNPNFLDVGQDINLHLNRKRGNSISTPCAKRISTNLFHCALSPITGMKLDGFHVKINPNPDGIEKVKKQPRPAKQVCFEINLLTPDKTNNSVVQFRPSKIISQENQRKSRSAKIIEEAAQEKSRSSKKISEAQGLRSSKIISEPQRPSQTSKKISQEAQRQSRSSVKLQPGKWRKSLSTWRRTNLNDPSGAPSPRQSLPVRKITAESLGVTHLTQRKSVYVNQSLEPIVKVNYKREVLKYCGQRRPHRFKTNYAAAKMLDTCKIGEGVYGEVFKYTPKTCLETNLVLKVIPIEGDTPVNGEVQKTYEQILPEIIISQEMSNLRVDQTNSTIGFVNINNVCLVKGQYPKHLIELWEEFDAQKESENEHPEIFTESQLFIVLELKFAGQDMSAFTFFNAEQSYYALQQIILTLAVGEEAFQFEHRDLHWGNILIQETQLKQISYKLDGIDLTVATKGICITIIDYTLSRIMVDECCHYNDLSTDEELFVATGDYQYDIYRMMRDELNNDWSTYAPRTNVLWLSYVNSKLIDGVKYKNPNTKAHKSYMEKLKSFSKIALTLNSAIECVKHFENLN